MRQNTKENIIFNRALTIVTNKVIENRRSIVVGVTFVTLAAVYKYKHEISIWGFNQTYRFYRWWKGNN